MKFEVRSLKGKRVQRKQEDLNAEAVHLAATINRKFEVGSLKFERVQGGSFSDFRRLLLNFFMELEI